MTTATAEASNAAAPRTEKDLLIASRAYTAEDRRKSWLLVLSSLALLAGLTAGATMSSWGPLRLAFSVVEGLTIVRVFCLFHDFQHGAILRQSKVAEAIFWFFGLSITSPASVWKETHDYHHANTSKMVGSHIGSYPIVTAGMWKAMSPRLRFGYKLVRSPLNIVLAVFTIFGLGMCVSPVLRAPKKHWSGALSLLFVYGTGAALTWVGRGELFVFGWLIPMWIAAMSGAYLFFAQHTFPDAHIKGRHEWTFVKAAVEASSYMVMGPVMRFFTANIGFHHVHHLNATIPFYRLPEAMAGIPELQNPGKTSLSPKDIAYCLSLKVWDTEKNAFSTTYPSV